MVTNMQEKDDLKEPLISQESDQLADGSVQALHSLGSLQRKGWLQRASSSFARKRAPKAEVPSTPEASC